MSDRHEEYAPDKVPTSITRTIYVGYGIGKYNAGKIVIDDFSRKGTSSDFAVAPLAEQKITIKLPKCKVDVKKRMLEVLEEQKCEVLAENHARLKAVQDQIDELLAIEYHPSRESGVRNAE